jgi:hypothetical protein
MGQDLETFVNVCIKDSILVMDLRWVVHLAMIVQGLGDVLVDNAVMMGVVIVGVIKFEILAIC